MADRSVEMSDPTAEEIEIFLPRQSEHLLTPVSRKKCCAGGTHRKRPDCTILLIFTGLSALLGLIFLPMGIWAVYDYKHYISTNYTIIDYEVSQEFCSASMLDGGDGSDRPTPWTVSVIGKYYDYIHDENGDVIPRLDDKGYHIYWTGRWIRVCGYYADQSLTKAKTKYPLGENVSSWVFDDRMGDLIFRDPSSQLTFMWCFVTGISVAIFTGIFHILGVMFCGFKAINKNLAIRVTDPYH